jgi:hypothetical protein
MVDQTKMSSRIEENGHTSGGAAARSVGQILHDILTLAQLQGRLFTLDAQQAGTKIQRPFLALAAGAVLAVCSVPVALIGIAVVLVDVAGLSRVAAIWITFLIAAVAAGCLIGYAIAWLRKPPSLFQCSREELGNNIDRVKEMLHRSSSTSPSSFERRGSKT